MFPNTLVSIHQAFLHSEIFTGLLIANLVFAYVYSSFKESLYLINFLILSSYFQVYRTWRSARSTKFLETFKEKLQERKTELTRLQNQNMLSKLGSKIWSFISYPANILPSWPTIVKIVTGFSGSLYFLSFFSVAVNLVAPVLTYIPGILRTIVPIKWITAIGIVTLGIWFGYTRFKEYFITDLDYLSKLKAANSADEICKIRETMETEYLKGNYISATWLEVCLDPRFHIAIICCFLIYIKTSSNFKNSMNNSSMELWNSAATEAEALYAKYVRK